MGGALVNIYSKCGALVLARSVFDMLPQKDQFSCFSLVSEISLQFSLLIFHNLLEITQNPLERGFLEA